MGGTGAIAKALGVDPNYINMILRGERSLGTNKAHLLADLFGLTYIEMIEKGKNIHLEGGVETTRPTKKHEPKEAEDLERLLQMTREVLSSKTYYAESLEMNIRAFHLAITGNPTRPGRHSDSPPDPPDPHPASREETGT